MPSHPGAAVQIITEYVLLLDFKKKIVEEEKLLLRSFQKLKQENLHRADKTDCLDSNGRTDLL